MSATKIWSIGDLLTAADLNSNFTKLPYASAAFTFTQAAALAPNAEATTAVVFPAGRFNVAPIVTASTSSSVYTAYVSAITSGTATIGVRNNGSFTPAANAIITGFAVQMTSGTAAG
jgi:hypothetical protein